MERGHDYFKCRLSVVRMLVNRNPATIIGDTDAVTGLIEFNRDRRGIPVEVFVNGIVQDFPRKMVQDLQTGSRQPLSGNHKKA